MIFGIGNQGNYHGDDLRDLIDQADESARMEYFDLAWRLIDLIGRDAYNAWVDANITGPWSRNVELIKAKLAEENRS